MNVLIYKSYKSLKKIFTILDIAEIVLNKCMNVHDGDDGHCVTFSYGFVEDNGDDWESLLTETKHTGQSKRFKKQHHPLSLIVSTCR